MLEALFNPRSVAVIGASENPEKLGHTVLKNIVDCGYQGPVYPINPRSKEILGLPCYPRVTDVPEPVDLAVFLIPNRFVADVMRDCGAKGVKAAIVITAGFREVGPEGLKLEREVTSIARKHGIRMLGPNVLGLIDTSSSLNASFAADMPNRGEIAFMSQSGALCTGILDWAAVSGLGFSKFISLGNKADLNEVDFLDVWADDAATEVILAYLEGIVDGPRFMKTARALTKRKPVIVIKSGTTDAGSRAVSSHTGTLAGSERAYDAAFAQCGVIRARSVEDLFNYATAFAYQPLPAGRRVAIVTNAGGSGIMATDACERAGLHLASFTPETIEHLRANLPAAANVYNPIDVLGDAFDDRYRLAVRAALNDENVDTVLVLLAPQALTPIREIAQAVVDAARGSSKPVLTNLMGGKRVAPGIEILNRGRVPNYDFPEEAAAALAAMVRQREWQLAEAYRVEHLPADQERVRQVLAQVRTDGRLALTEIEAREVVLTYGLPLPRSEVATSAAEAVRLAEEIGYPVVMKIVSPDILHKTDIGGVRVGLQSAEEVRSAYQGILVRARRYLPRADIWGVAVQEMAPPGKEVIIGVNRDPTFGPMIMFGLGGIYVEVLKDVAFRIAPLPRRLAREMVQEIRSYPLLAGVRGERPADIDAIVDVLLRVSQLVTDFPEIVELDINPLFVYEAGKGAMAVDARMVIGDV